MPVEQRVAVAARLPVPVHGLTFRSTKLQARSFRDLRLRSLVSIVTLSFASPDCRKKLMTVVLLTLSSGMHAPVPLEPGCATAGSGGSMAASRRATGAAERHGGGCDGAVTRCDAMRERDAVRLPRRKTPANGNGRWSAAHTSSRSCKAPASREHLLLRASPCLSLTRLPLASVHARPLQPLPACSCALYFHLSASDNRTSVLVGREKCRRFDTRSGKDQSFSVTGSEDIS